MAEFFINCILENLRWHKRSPHHRHHSLNLLKDIKIIIILRPIPLVNIFYLPASILNPAPFSGKVMLFTAYATSMILFTCYSAVLVSILTTMAPTLPFRDFKEMLENPDWNLGVRTNTALADALAVSWKGGCVT